VAGNRERLAEAAAALSDGGVPVSMFVEPAEEQLVAAREAGAAAVELHTGAYANAGAAERPGRLAELAAAARFAGSLRLGVAAGHGLTYYNVKPVAAIPEIEELNIGHSIVARAMFVGLEEATRAMLALMREARAGF
jgi:pyridoxine 5-phosphate synthase